MNTTRNLALRLATGRRAPTPLLVITALVGSLQTGCADDGGASATSATPATRALYAACVMGERCEVASPCMPAVGLCTRSCARDTDCPSDASGHPGVCGEVRGVRVCVAPCSAGAACGAGTTCTADPRRGASYCVPVATSCGGLGEACCENHRCAVDGLLCHREFSYLGGAPHEICTKPCEAEEDCADVAGAAGVMCISAPTSYCVPRCGPGNSCGVGLTCARINRAEDQLACLRASCGGDLQGCCEGTRCNDGMTCVSGLCRTVVAGAYAACSTIGAACSAAGQTCEPLRPFLDSETQALACSQRCDPMSGPACPSDGSNQEVCLYDERNHVGQCVRTCRESSECAGSGGECVRVPSGSYAGLGLCARGAP